MPLDEVAERMPEAATRETRGPEERAIVVGVDGSEYSRLALKWAADEAKLRGSVLHVVFAGAGGPKEVPGWYEAGSDQVAAGKAVVDDAVGLVATRHPSVVVRGEALEWPGALALIDASVAADLLVVGARGKGGFKGLLLGSVSHQCIQHAHCPVVVVHSRSEDPAPSSPGHRIVVGIDGSDGSDRALQWALAEARFRSAVLEGIYGWKYPPMSTIVMGRSERYEAAARSITDAASLRAEQWEPGVRFESVSHFDAPVATLLEASDGADLLVVGARGRGGFHDMVLGSVAQQCANHARCPVVVVRPPAVQPDLAAPA